MENAFTIRIHLDDCDKSNGALKVIRESHKDGVVSADQIAKLNKEEQVYCEVKQGGVLVMKPLLLHASSRTENNRSRRVIHLEFNDRSLPDSLSWLEQLEIF